MISFYYIYYYLNKVYSSLSSSKVMVLYRNKDVLMIDKEADMKINSNCYHEITVQTLLREVFPNLANPFLRHEFYFPQRLDYSTSGVMCIPIHKTACRLVSDAFLLRQAKKYYVAIVRGLLSEEFIELDMPIGRDIREQFVVKMCSEDLPFCENPVSARTLFLVLEEGLYDNYPSTKLLIRPVTGRTHQIRVHLSYLGHTIVGDYNYSNRKDNEPPRMYLHSKRLILNIGDEIVDVESPESFFKVSKWRTVRVINNFDEFAYKKIESYV